MMNKILTQEAPAMDLSTAIWLSKMKADYPSLLRQWGTTPIRKHSGDLHFNHFSSENSIAHQSPTIEYSHQTTKGPAVHEVVKNIGFNVPPYISFGESNSTSSRTMDVVCKPDLNFNDSEIFSAEGEIYGNLVEYVDSVKSGVNRTPLQAQDHILAERKRRQKLSELFIALSAIVPGLKKLDKASVIGGAINYLKQLEQRLQDLDYKKKKHHEQNPSLASSKRTKISPSHDQDTSSSIESGSDRQLPEIEVRVSGDNVLIKIFCTKINGILNNILRVIEKLPLSVITSVAMPFGNTTLCITIIAQMDGDFTMKTSQEVAADIREAAVKLLEGVISRAYVSTSKNDRSIIET